MKTKYISFHNGNIPSQLLEAQLAVFQHFKIPLQQIKTELQHPDAIDHFLNTAEWDIVVIFDIDCIPLEKDYLDAEVNFVSRVNNWIVGAAQHASHIPNSIDYVSPAYMVMHRAAWEALDKPSFAPTKRGDVGAEITYKAIEHGQHYFMLPVSSCEVPMWKLDNGQMFGIGTTYADVIYHAFESRMNADARNRFIEKCRAVVATPVL